MLYVENGPRGNLPSLDLSTSTSLLSLVGLRAKLLCIAVFILFLLLDRQFITMHNFCDSVTSDSA